MFGPRHVECGGGQGRTLPLILADQKAPPGSGCAPHYYMPPPRFLDFATCLLLYEDFSSVTILVAKAKKN